MTAPVKARKCVTADQSSDIKYRFNVTAPVKARKCAVPAQITIVSAALQCDRACEGAEISSEAYGSGVLC